MALRERIRRWLGVNDAPAPVPEKRGRKIGHGVIGWAGANDVKKHEAFIVSDHPPGVLPFGTKLAMDDNVSAALGWANGCLQEGVVFPGFPFLSQLAQRPEYRKITETIASEMTRAWITFESAGGDDEAKQKAEKIKAIEAEFGRLHVQDMFRKAAEGDGYFGRGHIFLDLGETDDREELKSPVGDGWNSMSQGKVGQKSLRRLRYIEPMWVAATTYNSTDPLKGDWFRPVGWYVMGKEVHTSRLLTFIGRPVPDLLKPTYLFSGLSMSQMAQPYVDNWIKTREAVSDLISSFSFTGLKTDLTERSQIDDGAELLARLKLFTTMRDNRGTLAIDKDTEDFFNISVPLGTLDKLQAQSQEQLSSVSSIPLVKLLGITPSGLNASSDGEIRVFYDWIAAYQGVLFRDNLHRLLGFVQLSLFGEVDPAITIKFNPLYSLNEKEQAEVNKIEAETGAVLINANVISPEEERKRVATDKTTPYTSLDAGAAPVAVLSDLDKASIASTLTAAVAGAAEAGLVDDGIAMRELAKIGAETGLWSSLTPDDIAQAEAEPPAPELPDGTLPEAA
ncbi:DUF1073 domain-containing protein [Bosea sp. ASV33]|uniref:DUF1073 domain-containing protein n=1 Tax=Bosea sp. ASV33 TaxID=2795106 RepID=UPI0018EBA94F|nr:DUF1073 domain-containing protein [Bosea sp. ASV33]